MTACASSLLKEFKSLLEYGSRNAFIDKYCESYDDEYICCYSNDYEVTLHSFLKPETFASRTVSPASFAKLGDLANSLSFSSEFKASLDLCRKNNRQSPERNSQDQTQTGVIPLLLADPVNDKGYIAETKVFSGTGESHPLLNRAAALIQEFCRRKNLPEFSFDPSNFACDFIEKDLTQLKFTEITGNSLGLPLLLALFSCICKEPLPSDIAASAELGSDGKLLPVGNIDAKMAALRSERYYVKRIFVAVDQVCNIAQPGLEICKFTTIFELLSKIFSPEICRKIDLPLDIDKTLRLVDDEYRDQQWELCIANATALIDSDTVKSKTSALFTAYSCRGAAYCHRGEITRSQNDFKKADKLYNRYPNRINDHKYFDMCNREGVALKDVFRYPEALKAHEKNCKGFTRLGADEATQAKNISSLSQLLSAQGKYPEALKLQKKALKLLRQAGEDLARNYGYLADIQTHAGNFSRAGWALGEARKCSGGQRTETPPGKSVPFLDWYEAQLLYRQLENSKNRRPLLLEKLRGLRNFNLEITFHAPAMVHKFANLGELLCGDKSALSRLDDLIYFLTAKTDSTYQLLAASVRIERQIVLLGIKDTATIELDIEAIIRHLQFQPDIKKLFHSKLTALQRHCQKIDSGVKTKTTMQAIIEILQDLQNNIPY